MTREEAIKWLIRPIVSSTEIGEFKAKELKAYELAIEALSEPKTGWIPVSERLPKEPNPVLVTILWHEPYDNYEVSIEEYWDNGEGWGDLENAEIVAWMPLPDVYREDGEV